VVHARTDGEEHTVDEPLIHCFDGKQLVLAFVGRTALADYFRMARVYGFSEEHWRRIRTNNPLERILREIRRRTRVVGAFPDGQSALNLAAARLRHVAGTVGRPKNI